LKNKLLTLAGALALAAVLGHFYAKPLMAQVRAALVQDVDQPARAPFQATVNLTLNNFNFTPVTIPPGKRLVIDQVSYNGAAQTAGSSIQPLILLQSSVAGGPAATYYLSSTALTDQGQYYAVTPMTVYSDSLQVGWGFSGFTPTFFNFNVNISGHLVSIP